MEKTKSICSLLKIDDSICDGKLIVERKAVQIFHIINTVTSKIFEVDISNDCALEEAFMKDRVEVGMRKIRALYSC